MNDASAGWQEELLRTLQGLGAERLEGEISAPCFRLPVRGGVFRHPLTREAIAHFVLYGAGSGLVKIAWPRFLWCLPRLKLEAKAPEQFFAAVAKQLGAALAELSKVRDLLSAMGISMELERDALLLRGRAKLALKETELAADVSGRVVIEAIEGRSLAQLARSERSLALGKEAALNLERLGELVARLTAQPAAGEEAPVLELTEVIEDASRQSAPPPPSRGPPAAGQSMGALALAELWEKFGSGARIAALDGRLVVDTTLRVVQGVYGFRLEQRGPTRFAGVLLTPAGQRWPVEFELSEIMDLKDILDRYLMGR